MEFKSSTVSWCEVQDLQQMLLHIGQTIFPDLKNFENEVLLDVSEVMD